MVQIQPLSELKPGDQGDQAEVLVGLIENGPDTIPPAIGVREYLVLPDELVGHLVALAARRDSSSKSLDGLARHIWVHPTIGLLGAVVAWLSVNVVIHALFR